ncbi:CAP domain-containing protein [Sphingosinicella terrae]|uniref:CAP domain-containing protein n=1 Tax=Sphingosinicella terrae TaxID=2172047 RepID=UPI000E0E048D|nr:CAP domain-containing protein [Sphingosinicella terrae]
MPPRSYHLLLLASLMLAGCGGSRPPWADGAMVRSEAPADAPPQDLRDLPGRLTALHNRERSAVAAAPLRWDTSLAAAAAAYGPALERLGRLAHSPVEGRTGQGENLWMGTRGAYPVDQMVGSWAAERRLFEPGTFPEVSRSGHWSDVAHYTQMIWPATVRFGCAVHRSAQWDFLICRYAPAGNVVGQRVP